LTVLTPERGEKADSTYRAAATRWGSKSGTTPRQT